MARADTLTWLALDEWAEIIGVNPLWFNQLSSTFFSDTVCGDIWFQRPWQHADRVGREDLAEAISEAETAIANEVGYNLMPDWVVDERTRTASPADPTLYNANGLNVRLARLSVETDKFFLISGGRKALTLIQEGVAITRVDRDGDGYAETISVDVATTVTDASEIRVFYPGEDGNPEWEIRPISVTFPAGVARIEFNSWLAVGRNPQWDRLSSEAIDGDDNASYLSTIDVYRVYNDPQSQLQMLWEPIGGSFCDCSGAGCTQCSFGTQNGCLMVRDARLGMVTYGPANWNASTSGFDEVAYAVGRNPNRVRLWYYSGWRDNSLDRPNAVLDKYWKQAIAYYAASLLDREIPGCDNVREFIKKWSIDRALAGRSGGYQTTEHQIGNRFGTTAGAIFALNRAANPDRRVSR